MKRIISLMGIVAALGAYSTTHVYAEPGSVTPIPGEEDGPKLPDEGGQGDEPEQEIPPPPAPSPRPSPVPSPSPAPIPRPSPSPRPIPRPQPRPLPPEEEPEYPGEEDGGKGSEDQPRPPQRPQHPGRPDHPGRPPRDSRSEVVQIRQQFLGQTRLPLYMLTNNLASLQGYRLVGVTIFGYSQAGMGGAFFCSSQCSQIQPVGGYPGAYRIQTVSEPINQFAGQWFLELRGNFAIETIQLEFVR